MKKILICFLVVALSCNSRKKEYTDEPKCSICQDADNEYICEECEANYAGEELRR